MSSVIPRRSPRVSASLKLASGVGLTAPALQVDARGCTVRVAGARIQRGDMLRLKLDEIGPFDARVATVTAHSVMLDFVDPLHPAVAAMLSSR